MTRSNQTLLACVGIVLAATLVFPGASFADPPPAPTLLLPSGTGVSTNPAYIPSERCDPDALAGIGRLLRRDVHDNSCDDSWSW